MDVYFIRHGQTEWNRDGVIQGQKNSPLTELGNRQATLVGEYFKERGIDIFKGWCSDLGRCVETMDGIKNGMNFDFEIEYDSVLRERGIGSR